MHLPEIKHLAAALVIALAAPASAQSDAAEQGSELAKLKAEFLADMRREISSAGKHYLAELQKLERKFAIAGNYEGAIAARDERASMEKFLAGGSATTASANPNSPTPEPAPPKTHGIQLVPSAATLSAGAAVADGNIRLHPSGATASWIRGSIAPGGYEVVISYSAAADTTVQAKESFFRLTATLPATQAGKITSAKLGTLKVTSRADTISLRHTGTDNSSKLVVHSVKLISAKD